MKKIILLAAFFVQSSQLNIYPQDTINNLYPIESHGERVILDIKSQYTNNSIGSNNPYNLQEMLNHNASLNGTIWKYTKKLDYLGALSVIENYYYDSTEERSSKNHAINTNLYSSVEYYFKPDKFYINGSYALTLSYQLLHNMQKIDTVLYDYGSVKAWATNYLWIAIGYGKLINKARETKLDNFEKVLRKPLSNDVKKKIIKLIEKRNNRDYQAKYKDNDEINFFGDIERLLLKEGIITQPLGAETVMKLYQTLANTKFLYYPKFTGLQSQIEIQYNPTDEKSRYDFVILSSTYAQNIKNNTSSLISGFLSVPLRDNAPDNSLFFNVRNPFSNILPLIAENFGMDFYYPSFYGDYQGVLYLSNMDYLGGLKLQLFHSFSNSIGINVWAQGIAVKPKNIGYRNTLKLGLQVDFNVISFINLTAGAAWFRNNSGFQQLTSNIGTKLIIF